MRILDYLKSKDIDKVHIFLFSLVTFAAFWKCIFLPFIQDDWHFLEEIHRHETFSLIIGFFNPKTEFFYRPFAQLYFLIMYEIFGGNPLPFHIFALIIHGCNSLLVAATFGYIVKDRLIGILSGLIYAVALSVHLDTLLWAVGIYDLGATFFFFISIFLFLKDRYRSSIICFFIAVFFKESVIVLPLILAGFCFFLNQRTSLIGCLKSTTLKIFPYIIISVMIFCIKILAEKFVMIRSPSHPYAFDLISTHFFSNLYSYLTWMSQSLIPLDNQLPAFVIGFIFIIFTGIKISDPKWKYSSPITFLFCWVFICLLPVLFLPNHTYRYYAIYALPAFVCGILVMIKEILRFFNFNLPMINKILVAYAIVVVSSSIFQSNRILGQGLEYKTFSDGTNLLVARAVYVDITQSFLLNSLPIFPDNAVLVFEGVDIWAFNKDSGPRVWYKNKTLHVYELHNLKNDSNGWYIENPKENQVEAYTGSDQKKIYVDPAKLYVFRLVGDQMHLIPHKELKES